MVPFLNNQALLECLIIPLSFIISKAGKLIRSTWIISTSSTMCHGLLRLNYLRKRKQGADFYKISGTGEIVRAGDCVLMKASDPNAQPYVARVEKLETNIKGNVRVDVRWYYRPEEASCGRQTFHGAKELLLSDHYDNQSAKTIEGKCIVHPFKEYTKLEDVGAEDYYSRFEYKARTKEITPDRISVYCKCELPYNPDDLMIQCDGCKDWFHPVCVKMTTAQAKQFK